MTPFDIAKAYTPALTPHASALRPDPARSSAAATAYAALPHTPHDPLVASAYDALKREIKAQHTHLVKHGVRIEPWTGEGQPYRDSDHMREDAAAGHLHFFPTGAEMDETHPLAEVDHETGHRYNDLFRAVHDYFGHAVHPHQFGPTGEIRAWHEHAKMFTPLARLALTTETHGQNSWVNFGPHSHLPVTDRPYAEQKAAILPEEHHPMKLARDEVDEPWKVERVGAHLHHPILADDLEERNWHHDQRTLDLLRGDVTPPAGHSVHVAVNPFSKKVQAWHDNHGALRPTTDGVHGPGGQYRLVHDGNVDAPRYMVVARNANLPSDTPVAREPHPLAQEIARRLAWNQPLTPQKRVPTPLPARFRMSRLVPKDKDADALIRPYAQLRPGKTRGVTGLHMLADVLHEKFPDHPAAEWFPHIVTHPNLRIHHEQWSGRQPLSITHRITHHIYHRIGHVDAARRLTHELQINFGTHRWSLTAPVESLADVRAYVAHHPDEEPLVQSAQEIGLPEKLARVKAPAGGGIVNNTYGKGGTFLAKPRRRIAEVVAGLKRLKLSRATAPDGGPGDAIHEEHGPHGSYAVWPTGDGRMYVMKHDPETGDATDHFSDHRLVDDFYFRADQGDLARMVVRRLAHRGDERKLRLSRANPIGRAALLESKGIDPATKHFTHDDVVKLDPVLAKEAAFVEGKINASVPQLAEHFKRMAPDLSAMSNHQIGKHLLKHVSAELPADPDPDMRDWYGPHSRAAVTGFHEILGYPDHPDDPHQVIAKMLLAITSNNAHPNLHYGATVRILKSADGDPAKMPVHNEPALARFRELAPRYGVPVPLRFKDETHAALWAREHHPKIKRLLSQNRDAGYYGAPAIVGETGAATVSGKGESSTGSNAYVPLLQDGKVMLPKRWSAQSSVGDGIERLRSIVRALGVAGAAKFLTEDHHPDDVRAMGGLSGKAKVTVDYLPATGSTPGSFVFGPKIGSFFQNVHGNERYMTADRWLGYTAGRMGHPGMFHVDKETGKLTGTTTWGKAKRQLMYRVLEALVAKHPKSLRSIAQAQAILWGPEQEIANQYTVKKRVPGNFGEASKRAVKTFGKKPPPTLFDGM